MICVERAHFYHHFLMPSIWNPSSSFILFGYSLPQLRSKQKHQPELTRQQKWFFKKLISDSFLYFQVWYTENAIYNSIFSDRQTFISAVVSSEDTASDTSNISNALHHLPWPKKNLQGLILSKNNWESLPYKIVQGQRKNKERGQ